jgi:hypothetical protein
LWEGEAERSDPQTLVETFVDTGALGDKLRSHDHQVIHGRRGTGKTHALYFLADLAQQQSGLPVYIDLRTIGSSSGIYNDESLPLAERGTRLLLDVMGAIQNELVDYVLRMAEQYDMDRALALLDALAREVTYTRVEGTVEMERTTSESSTATRSGSVEIGAGKDAGIKVTGGSERAASSSGSVRLVAAGVARHRVHFGALSHYVEALIDALSVDRLWLLLDEWSSVPQDLQPLLADLLRRCVLPVRMVTVKIAAIEHRSVFYLPTSTGYLGLELGADISADFDLDDFLVFGNDEARAVRFFQELMFRHVVRLGREDGTTEEQANPVSSDDFVRQAFTQATAFVELVRAAEGVPRDAINIANIAATHAGDQRISVPDIRAAARRWYLGDKEPAATANPEARQLLHWIIDEVIGGRRARAFLLRQGDDQSHPLVQGLYDARVLHVIKKGVAARDQPGIRFNVYCLDYGCYVELITTDTAPLGLFEAEDDGGDQFVSVPKDDYRSIRRAILSLDAFESRPPRLLDKR